MKSMIADVVKTVNHERVRAAQANVKQMQARPGHHSLRMIAYDDLNPQH